MSIEKETLSYVFPKELLNHFAIVSVQELGDIAAKEDYYEVVFEEKNNLLGEVDASQYESKGFFTKTVQDFPLRGKAVFLKIRRRRWRHKLTKEEITNDFTFLAGGSKFTKELADFLKEAGRDPS